MPRQQHLADYHSGQARLVLIDLPFVGIALIVMAIVGGPMVFVPASLFLGFAALAIGRARKFRRILDARTAQDNRKYDFIAEVLTGIHTVKAMAMEPQMQRRFERLQEAVARTTMSSISTGQANQTAALLFGSVSQLIVVAIGGTHVINDQLSMGALACCTMLSGQILQPLLRAISLWTEQETVAHRRAEVKSLLDLPAAEAPAEIHAAIDGNIRFEKVIYIHPNDSNHPLSVSDMSIEAGTIIGVKGKEGSGRTTLLNLIKGEIEPATGCVTIDGISTLAPQFASIRRHIAYVGASPVIFSGTIMENLTMFGPEKRDFARKMAQLLGLETTINLLPDGYETKLGEGIGDDLPMSIAQQMNIVRALTNRPRVLALDEANVLLDAVAEPALIRALNFLRGSLTVIVVTHRPSLLALCDHQINCSRWSRRLAFLLPRRSTEAGDVTSFDNPGSHPDGAGTSAPGAIENQVHANLARLAAEFGSVATDLSASAEESLISTINDIVHPETPAEACLAPTLALFGWAGEGRLIREALPHFDRIDNIEALRRVLSLLGYGTTAKIL